MDISKIKEYIKTNRPEIEIVSGIFGYGFSVYFAVKNTIQLEKEKAEAEEQTKQEEILMYAKAYAKPTLLFAVSTGLALDSHNETIKRAIGPTTAYLLTEKAYKEYGSKVKEVIGKKKEEEIRAELGKERAEANPVSNNVIVETGDGNTLFYDCVTGRYFLSDLNKIKQAVNEFNKKLLDERELGLNEFYSLCNLDSCSVGDILGCHCAFELLEINYSSGLLEDDRQCIFLDYAARPLHDMHEY